MLILHGSKSYSNTVFQHGLIKSTNLQWRQGLHPINEKTPFEHVGTEIPQTPLPLEIYGRDNQLDQEIDVRLVSRTSFTKLVEEYEFRKKPSQF
ncbi:hypothetical protein MAR_028216 [Mya arenaria]|uniref:Uncharacterized protein n=1 Tax=Mya arenaria TaxID=6604 RepID=A0ABY7DFX7_MYAAR|nr:hypothetical protein MAR_028216 [Mya arenaria]